MCVLCEVATAGELQVGDPVEHRVSPADSKPG